MTNNNAPIYPQIENTLYFDGCSKSNPGQAGIGAVLYINDKEICAKCKYIGIRTNNEAEYEALIFGLDLALIRGIKDLIVYGDSMLIIKQMVGQYKVKEPKLIQLYQTAYNLASKFNYIEYKHVYRKFNKRADALANQALLQINDTDTSEDDKN